MSVFQNLVCLSLVVCSDFTETSNCVVFIFFHGSSMGAAYLWMWLIHGMFTVIIVINLRWPTRDMLQTKNDRCKPKYALQTKNDRCKQKTTILNRHKIGEIY